MKCPICGFDKIQPNYKFCPKCRTSLIPGSASAKHAPIAVGDTGPEVKSAFKKKSEEAPAVVEKPSGIPGGIDIVKNKAIWSIAPGEVARHITPQEFDSLSNLSGLIIEDGVSAIVYVDGQEVASLNSGVYNFASKEIINKANAEVDRQEKEDKENQGILGKARETARKIWRFFTGEKKGEKAKEREARKARVRDAIQKITAKSVVSVYLKADRVFPATLSTNGEGFIPYSIKTKFVDAEVGVSLQLQVSNFHAFIRHFMPSKKSVTILDVEKELDGQIRTLLQRNLRTYEIDQIGIDEDLKSTLTEEIIALNDSFFGVNIIRVLDITCDNEDFERFRKIEKELYCSEIELNYLHRTNEFKNRLAAANNERIVNEAKTDLDLRKALDEVNKDNLLHEDELEQFVELLSVQRRIRQATNEVEEEKALLQLKGNQLVNEDDFEEIVADLENKKFNREQVSEIFRIKALANTAKARLLAETELTKESILAEEEISEAEFEVRKKQIGRDTEEVDLEAILYGRQFVLQKQQTLDALELENITLEKKLEAQQKIDEYSDKRADAEYEREKRRSEDEIELLRKKAEIARASMEALKAQELKEKEMDISLEKERLSYQSSMSAEQITAQGLSGLDAAAQAEFMKALGSSKTAAEKEALYREMLEMQKASSEKTSEQQMEMMRQMMDFAKSSSAATAAAATGRMDMLNELKEEYREEAHREQARVDKAQETALKYTTRITSEELRESSEIKRAGTASASAKKPDGYKIPVFGDTPFSFEQVATYISSGVVTPVTEFEVNGEIMVAADISELYPLLVKFHSVDCPVCGNKGLKGTFCPECGSEL